MRAVVQRVTRAAVTVLTRGGNGGAESTAADAVQEERVGAIGPGLCVLVGVGRNDDERAASELADKIFGLRIFEDEAGKMNRNVVDAGGALLLVSQFTLFGDARKGRRPSFTDAMEPVRAKQLFELVVCELRARGVPVETGRFRAEMQVELVNDGPITLLLDTERVF